MPNDMSQPTPQPMQVSLVMTPALYKSLQTETGALEVAKAYQIDSHEMAVMANDELKSIKKRLTQVKEWRDGFVEPAKQIIENAKSLFNPALESLTAAEGTLKLALTNWQESENKRIAEEQRKIREEEERARQKAAQEAAAARAKAQEQARELERQAREAEEARQKAIAEGNAKAAAEAAANAAKLQEKAVAQQENGEAKAAALEVAAAAAVSAAPTEAPKLKGFGTRENWVAMTEKADDDENVVKAIVNAIAGGRTDLLALLKLDMPAANKLAKAQKKHFNVPGMVARDVPVATSRG